MGMVEKRAASLVPVDLASDGPRARSSTNITALLAPSLSLIRRIKVDTVGACGVASMVGSAWLGIAAVLAVYNAILIGFGIAFPSLTGYGTFTDMFIGVGVLIGSVLLFFFRRIVQDHAKVTFREPVPTEPSPEQMALLREELAVPVE